MYAVIDGSNDGKNTFEIAMMKTDSSKFSPPPYTLESHNQFHDNKLRGVCIPSPSSTCRDTKAAGCYCCIGPAVDICIPGLDLCQAICS